MPHTDGCPVSIRRLTESDLPQLQALLESCTEFLEFQDESPVQPSAARKLFQDIPPEASPEAKVVLGVFGDDMCGLIGVVDLILDLPDPASLWLGLMLMDPACRGRGIGMVAYRQVEGWARDRGVLGIRLGVLSGNEGGLRFWKRAGYRETGRTGRHLSRQFAVLEKPIGGGAFPS